MREGKHNYNEANFLNSLSHVSILYHSRGREQNVTYNRVVNTLKEVYPFQYIFVGISDLVTPRKRHIHFRPFLGTYQFQTMSISLSALLECTAYKK